MKVMAEFAKDRFVLSAQKAAFQRQFVGSTSKAVSGQDGKLA
jgi:hypothetical protein